MSVVVCCRLVIRRSTTSILLLDRPHSMVTFPFYFLYPLCLPFYLVWVSAIPYFCFVDVLLPYCFFLASGFILLRLPLPRFLLLFFLLCSLLSACLGSCLLPRACPFSACLGSCSLQRPPSPPLTLVSFPIFTPFFISFSLSSGGTSTTRLPWLY